MFVFGRKWNWFDRREWCRGLPGSLLPVSETLPGKESLVHISARNHAERETVASVFSVPDSCIGLLFMEGRCNLAKGQLVLHPVLTPFCLPASFVYTCRMTASIREDAVRKARGKEVWTQTMGEFLLVFEKVENLWGEQCFLFSLWGSGKVFKKGILIWFYFKGLQPPQQCSCW